VAAAPISGVCVILRFPVGLPHDPQVSGTAVSIDPVT